MALESIDAFLGECFSDAGMEGMGAMTAGQETATTVIGDIFKALPGVVSAAKGDAPKAPDTTAAKGGGGGKASSTASSIMDSVKKYWYIPAAVGGYILYKKLRKKGG